MEDLEKIAKEIRKELVASHHKYNLSHIGSELSCLDLLVSLYLGNVVKKDDKFILSKGHAAVALYAVLHRKGVISDALYASMGEDGSLLAVHPPTGVEGIDVATGSLGHGLPIALGCALATVHDKNPTRAFVIMSDGEMEEGSTLEAMNAAARLGLDNLVAIIDSNRWQAYDRTADIQPIGVTSGEFACAGWEKVEIDGHDYGQIMAALSHIPIKKGRPTLIVANTTKGKGLKSMEDKMTSHYKAPTEEQVREGIA